MKDQTMTKKSPTDLDRAIGARVRQARSAHGISQEQLAGRLGITFQQVGKYENGSNRICASRLYEIAALLGCSIEWLYGGDPYAGEAPAPYRELADKIARLPSSDLRSAVERIVDEMSERASA